MGDKRVDPEADSGEAVSFPFGSEKRSGTKKAKGVWDPKRWNDGGLAATCAGVTAFRFTGVSGASKALAAGVEVEGLRVDVEGFRVEAEDADADGWVKRVGVFRSLEWAKEKALS